MKRNELLYAALMVPLDYVAVFCAGWVAYVWRFHQVADFLPVATTTPQRDFLLLVLAVGWLWVIGIAIQGGYAIRQRSLARELGRVALGASLAVLLLIVFVFFRREFFASRFIVVSGWLLSILFLWLSHILVRLTQRYTQSRGVANTRIVLFGQDDTLRVLLNTLHSKKSLGYQVVKVFPAVTPESLAELETMFASQAVDEVWQVDISTMKERSLQLLEVCGDHAVTFKFVPDLFTTETGHVDITDLAGVPIVEIRRTALEGWGRILKRGLDLAGAVICLIIFLIPGAIVALAISIDSQGPVFIRLERVGQGQRKFYLWKFRSMIRDAHALKPQLMTQNERQDGPLFKMERDPRITRVGRFIRKTSIDELPQLFNVLQGAMSLVGPRPHEPEEVARYERHHKKLLTIKPGMTGMAQVSGRSQLSFEDEVRLDTYYIEHWTLGLDLQILARTPLAVLHIHTAA